LLDEMPSAEKEERSRNAIVGKVIGSFKEHVKLPKSSMKKLNQALAKREQQERLCTPSQHSFDEIVPK